MPLAEGWRDVRRVLAVRLDNLGDVVMTTPALGAVRESLPEAHIALLCSSSGGAVARHLSDIDETIVYDAPWVKGRAPRAVDDDLEMVERLARRDFDAAVIFTVYTQSALPAAMLCRLAGIPLRLAHSRENPYDLLTHWVPDPEPGQGIRHEVQRQLALVGSVGLRTRDDRLRFNCEEADRAAVQALLPRAGIAPGERFIVVHPGATAASRRYPAQRFGVAADAIARDSGCTVLFTGGRDEEPLVQEAQAAMRQRSVSLAGRLSLGEFAAVLERAQLLVSNNSGPVHLAAALGTPVVDLYALTNPQHTPWRVAHRVLNHDVPCRNCLKSVCPQGHHDCLSKVEPRAVVAAAAELLAERRETHAAGRSPSTEAVYA
ncbi:glycosyltransferase family 9 protein [Schlegelella sp. S2-27]|uniref:Glycosyltransferase family 9 protein n=1 Tax=Caldimonas mangrovi TaxID=2944811 RepID=A0ABT0YL67_9BURK|nr:glycosyltransferase family 9 protein [Caldimonas mangrovi]MCM5679479.1 glycosyltransferase family 9 protein [Caldimonas mangrovi]